MEISALFEKWCALAGDARVLLVTEAAQENLAAQIAAGLERECRLAVWEEGRDFRAEMAELRPCDLLIVLLSLDTYVHRYANRVFSPFAKPEGLAAKYAFIRLDIAAESLWQGLATPKEAVYARIEAMRAHPSGGALRVSGPAGTDMRLRIAGFSTCAHEISRDGEMAFLPPSETAAEVVPGTAEGLIVADVTVGQLYHYGKLLGTFGRAPAPVRLHVEKGRVVEIDGGEMGAELKRQLFALPPECRDVVELGCGLSAMRATGLIGVDESMIDTCHFGIGDGAKCGLHLDVVVGRPVIRAYAHDISAAPRNS